MHSLASMMVALPASIAFGVAVYGALGASSSARGALAGVLGAAALGLIAPLLGGTDRLVSAPCAPAAAVLGALALQMTAAGVDPEHALASIGLAAGAAAYLTFAAARELLHTQGNRLLVGPLGLTAGGLGREIAGRWSAIAGFGADDLSRVLAPALTLSVLLSIDTLKTCVVVDALTRSRHDSNREIVGQGIAGLAESHPRVSGQLFAHLARVLAIRLRHADVEIRALQEG